MKTKVGIIPYIIVDGDILFLLMIPSDPSYGGTSYQMAKGHLEDGESEYKCAVREGSEELGLKESNIKSNFKVGEFILRGMTEEYKFIVFACEVIDKDDFNKPHYETETTGWLTINDLNKIRKSQISMINKFIQKVENKNSLYEEFKKRIAVLVESANNYIDVDMVRKSIRKQLMESIDDIIDETKLPYKFDVGDKVRLRKDVLNRHSKSVPAHAGFTSDQFKWRETLGKLDGKVGVIERVFPNSKHVNVDFDGVLIGINNTELEPVVDESLIEDRPLDTVGPADKPSFDVSQNTKFIDDLAIQLQKVLQIPNLQKEYEYYQELTDAPLSWNEFVFASDVIRQIYVEFCQKYINDKKYGVNVISYEIGKYMNEEPLLTGGVQVVVGFNKDNGENKEITIKKIHSDVTNVLRRFFEYRGRGMYPVIHFNEDDIKVDYDESGKIYIFISPSIRVTDKEN